MSGKQILSSQLNKKKKKVYEAEKKLLPRALGIMTARFNWCSCKNVSRGRETLVAEFNGFIQHVRVLSWSEGEGRGTVVFLIR